MVLWLRCGNRGRGAPTHSSLRSGYRRPHTFISSRQSHPGFETAYLGGAGLAQAHSPEGSGGGGQKKRQNELHQNKAGSDPVGEEGD